MDTIFALSSGQPPAGIGVLRISGPDAVIAVERLTRRTAPQPRYARLRALYDDDGGLLDRALVLVFPGPGSVTGEDLVELHCHGGRAVIAAVSNALAAMPGLRRAEPGEFTRRALGNGRIDLVEAAGLADLLDAQTERQRLAAMAAAEGQVSQQVRGWLATLAMLSAMTEAQLDFADEDDVTTGDHAVAAISAGTDALAVELRDVIARPPVERLRDGISVVLAGPPNSGKSTLINLLAQRDLAIVSPIAGTTRDRIEATVTRNGLVYVLTDTAGLTDSDDPVERIGVSRAAAAIDSADLLLWLGDDAPPHADALWVHSRADQPGRWSVPLDRDLAVSQTDAGTIETLWQLIESRTARLVPRADLVAFRASERIACERALLALDIRETDLLLVAEHLRHASRALASILGVNATETMLDALFGRFCIGK